MKPTEEFLTVREFKEFLAALPKLKPEADKEILTVKEVAERYFRVKPGTVSMWIFRGVKIPFFKVEGTVLFRRSAILEFIKEKEAEALKRNNSQGRGFDR